MPTDKEFQDAAADGRAGRPYNLLGGNMHLRQTHINNMPSSPPPSSPPPYSPPPSSFAPTYQPTSSSPYSGGGRSYVPAGAPPGGLGFVGFIVLAGIIGLAGAGYHAFFHPSPTTQAPQPIRVPDNPEIATAPAYPSQVTIGTKHSLEMNTLLHTVYIKDEATGATFRLYGAQPTDRMINYDPWRAWNVAFKNAAYLTKCNYRDHGGYQCYLQGNDGKAYDVALWAIDQGVIMDRGDDAPAGYHQQTMLAINNRRGNWK